MSSDNGSPTHSIGNRSAARDTTVRRFVVGFTLVVFLYTVGYVVRFGSNVPVYDEWDLVLKVLPGEWSAEWLLAFHNEHRYPFAKLLWAVALKATGYDFRGPMLLTPVLLMGASLALTRWTEIARGRPRGIDVVVPAILLGWAHQFNLLMGYQVAFALIPVGVVGLLGQVIGCRPGDEARRGLFAGAWLAFLAANGGFGFGFVPPVAVWVAFLGWRAIRGGHLAAGLLVFVLPLLTVGYVAQSMFSAHPSTAVPALRTIARATAEYLTCGLGIWVTEVGWERVAVGVIALYAVAGGRTAWAARNPAERARAMGVLAILAGHLCVGLGLAWARGGGLTERYVTPSAAGFLAVWVALLLYGPRMSAAFAGLGVLGALALLAVNHRSGYQFGWTQWGYLRALRTDIRSGVPPTFVAGKYGNQFLTPPHLARTIVALRLSGHPVFRDGVPDPPMAAVPVSGGPTEMPAIDAAPFLPGGPPIPALRFSHPPPGRVLGLRLRVSTSDSVPWAEVVLRWNDATGQARSARGQPPFFPAQNHPVVFWIDGPATDVRLEPACPTFGYAITAAEWLLPVE